MAEITTTKEIQNPAQLDAALGNVGVTIRPREVEDTDANGDVIGTHLEYEIETSGDVTTDADLQAAVDAYVHDPNFGVPAEVKRKKELAAKADLTAADIKEAVFLWLRGTP